MMAMTVRFIPFLAVAITIGPSLAYASPACMTECEARAKFPKAHLYTHGSEHCWNDSAANGFRALPTVPVHSPRHPPRAAVPAPSPRPALAAARCFPHDPKSLTAVSTQKRNVDIHHVSKQIFYYAAVIVIGN
jgi:hypothetical protein